MVSLLFLHFIIDNFFQFSICLTILYMNQFIILITSFSDDKKKLQQLSLEGQKDKAKDKGRVILKFTFSKLKI